MSQPLSPRRPAFFAPMIAAVACAIVGGIVFGATARAGETSLGQPVAYRWHLPAGFPTPRVPADNPMTEAKVELGRRLFYDTRLSGNGRQSCASCHQQERAFTDGRPRAIGSTGEMHARSAMSLANVAYQPVLTWANPSQRALESQALAPMFGEHPVELGLTGHEPEMLARLSADARYVAWFSAAFPEERAPISTTNITKAIASFERTLVSGTSRYDRARLGDYRVLTVQESDGEGLFFNETAGCFQCHGGIMFTTTVDWVGRATAEVGYHNIGLYNVGDSGRYPDDAQGLRATTGDPGDDGKFKPPTLRNIALTAPYMHDGSIATLDEVIDHYAAAGRNVRSGPNAGDGSRNPNVSPLLRPFSLSTNEKAALIAFLRTLTDSAFVQDPRLSNPWADTLPR